MAGQLAGDGQGHADDAALGRRIRCLADLTFEGGHARGVDDHAAVTGRRRRILRHGRRCQTDDVERADQVDLDDLREARKRMRSGPAEDTFGYGDARALKGTVQAAEGLHRVVHRVLDACFIGDVGGNEASALSQFLGQSLAGLAVDIGDDEVAAGPGEQPDGRRAETGAAAADQEGVAGDVHPWPLTGWTCVGRAVV